MNNAGITQTDNAVSINILRLTRRIAYDACNFSVPKVSQKPSAFADEICTLTTAYISSNKERKRRRKKIKKISENE
jgi:hypothetical protein